MAGDGSGLPSRGLREHRYRRPLRNRRARMGHSTRQAKMEKEKTYRPGEWNEMWVSAHGSRLVVHVNGRKTADVTDSKQTRSSGILGLQLHGGQEMDVEFKDVALLVPTSNQLSVMGRLAFIPWWAWLAGVAAPLCWAGNRR